MRVFYLTEKVLLLEGVCCSQGPPGIPRVTLKLLRPLCSSAPHSLAVLSALSKYRLCSKTPFVHAALDGAVSNTIATPLQTALSSSRAVHCYTSLIFERDETHVPASTRNL